jgi:DNA-binding transcriptional regulator GbsR (MarR family)
MSARRAGVAVAERQETLTPQQARFVEAMGLLYERQGVPRIGGRMMGLFLISDEPLSPERIAELLKVSRASVSTNMRIFTNTGICDDVSVPGDRRHYYVMREDAFARHLESNMGNLRKLIELCRGALGAAPPGRSAARRRLQEAVAYCEFIEKEIAATLARWRSRRSR